MPIENLKIAQSTGHATEVQPLPPKQQKKWLDKSVTEDWSTSQLRVELRKAKRPKVSEGTTEPEPASAPTFDIARLQSVYEELIALEQMALDADLDIAGFIADARGLVSDAIKAVVPRGTVL